MYKSACLLVIALFGVVYAVPSQYDAEQTWVAGNLSYPLPSNALVGGLDPYGYKLYVGRVNFSGSVVPVRVVAETGIASGSTDIVPFTTRTYQLLTTSDNMDYEWTRSYDGILEENAVSVGTSGWNERVFICRARTDGGVIIGTLLLTRKACLLQALSYEYIHSFDKYEVLIAQPKNNGTFY
ncbi:uncharacterized protein LOC117787310 isoform X2 [Drosophila innubila]|uniref:uncharacterized protein LOC117787310 isoform X2 n=1 Tax=Drosophila innubila TaxID=198719 RepID=UPI00148CF537|nr:uncharacterized protein LOC117787310 isoform X2 [Drosophila innubila]